MGIAPRRKTNRRFSFGSLIEKNKRGKKKFLVRREKGADELYRMYILD